jgi:hypothetical protein
MKPTNNQLLGIAALGLVLFVAYEKGYFSPERGRNLDPAQAITDNSQRTISEANIQNTINTLRSLVLDTVALGNYFDDEELSQAIAKVNALNDADLIALSNAYNSRFPNDTYKTLYTLLNSVYLGYGFVGTAHAERAKLFIKLQKIGAA